MAPVASRGRVDVRSVQGDGGDEGVPGAPGRVAPVRGLEPRLRIRTREHPVDLRCGLVPVGGARDLPHDGFAGELSEEGRRRLEVQEALEDPLDRRVLHGSVDRRGREGRDVREDRLAHVLREEERRRLRVDELAGDGRIARASRRPEEGLDALPEGHDGVVRLAAEVVAEGGTDAVRLERGRGAGRLAGEGDAGGVTARGPREGRPLLRRRVARPDEGEDAGAGRERGDRGEAHTYPGSRVPVRSKVA